MNRKNFIKRCGLSSLPFIISPFSLKSKTSDTNLQDKSLVNFVSDGLRLSPLEYIQKLNEINQLKSIEADFYGHGGTTQLLEKEFAKITGKEKAIYLPSGTMANQLAIKLLNARNTKVIVPENSHIFRDEADAAQSVHNLRLIPTGMNKDFFEINDLKNTIEYLNRNEVFKSGLGTVSIENPIRRADGVAVPINDIKEISHYCRENGYSLHLDGARIHIACAYTKISLHEYASYFDTVYISLYKYLHATGGAILCGKEAIINQISHQIKIHGGATFRTWGNTAIALHYLKEIDQRWKKVVNAANQLIAELNKLNDITITELKNGTNIYDLKLGEEINPNKLVEFLFDKHSILLGRAGENGTMKFVVNESLLTRNIDLIIDAFVAGLKASKK